MKYLILISAFMLTFNIFSQTKTGSGGGTDDPKEFIFGYDFPDMLKEPQKFGPPKILVSRSELGARLVKLSHTLYDQNLLCSKVPFRILDMKDKRFSEIYLALRVYQLNSNMGGNCSQARAYFECLSSSKVKEEVRGMLQDKKMRIYLQTHFQIQEKEVETMLNFFLYPEKTCENDTCEM